MAAVHALPFYISPALLLISATLLVLSLPSVRGVLDENQLISLSNEGGSFSSRMKVDGKTAITSLAQQQGTLKMKGVAVEKILQTMASLWHRYEHLHQSQELPFETEFGKIARAGIQAIDIKYNKHGGFIYKHALEKVFELQSKIGKNAPARHVKLLASARTKALDLITAYREYIRLAHSYGDGHASADSFNQRGGEGAWLFLGSLNKESLKEIATVAGVVTTPEDPDSTLQNIADIARDKKWISNDVLPDLNRYIYRYKTVRKAPRSFLNYFTRKIIAVATWKSTTQPIQ